MASAVIDRIRTLFQRLTGLEWFAILLARVAMGIEFVTSGWGKLHDLEGFTKYFAELGIPAPGFNAVLTALTELGCGTLVLIGLAARLAAVPLAITMVVAIATAKIGEVHDLSHFLYLSEPSFLLIFVWLVFSGPGKVSVDHVIAKRFGGVS